MIQQAITLHRQGQLDDAERLYTQILEIHHEHFDALHLLGVLMHQRGRREEAVGLIAKAIAINPQAADAHANQARVLAALGRYEAALTSYERASALRPDDASTLRDRAKILNKLNQHEIALATYQKVLALEPNDAEALNDCGVLLHRMKRYDEAISSYNQALVSLPNNAILLNNRANAQVEMKRFEEALADFDRAVALQPDYADALNNRGCVQAELEWFEEALTSYDRAIAWRPNYADALNNRGCVLAELERFEEALTSYDRAIACRPTYIEALCNRGNVLLELNRYVEALENYQTALSLRPNDAEILTRCGNAFLELKRFDDALACYDRAITFRENFPEALYNEALYNRGLTQQEQNRSGVTLQPVRTSEQAANCYTGFYINLNHSTVRRSEIEGDIVRHGLCDLYQRFPAVDGNAFGMPVGRLTSGEIGCFMSHYLLLKQNVGQRTHLHVVEDDVVFSRHTGQVIRSVIASGAIDSLDILFTDTSIFPHRRDYRKFKALYDSSLERDLDGNILRIHPSVINYRSGTASYIVNYHSIRLLLELLGRELTNGLVEPLDLTVRRLAREGEIRVGCIFPFVTTLHIEQSANNTIGGRANDPLSRSAVCLARHSFFVDCDHQALNSRVAETLPLVKQGRRRQSVSDTDAHRKLLNHILAFSKTENYQRY